MTDAAAIEAIVASVAVSPVAAFDLEFLSADRLVPVLCLVQVAWLDAGAGSDAAAAPSVALIDPLAADVRGLVEALAAHPCCVVHGGRQDLGILATRFGIAMPGIVDTQILAAFAGLGDQIGFGPLAKELLGLDLDKGPQWTDWARRPLSDKQLAYARADVEHLPAIHAKLVARLGGPTGERVGWARAESREMAGVAVAASRITPETAWEDVGGLRGLPREALAAVVALAAWRLTTCRALDKPLGQLLNDKTLVELARLRPSEPGEVRGLKGISPLARTHAEAIVAALDDLPPAPPTLARATAPSPRAQRWSELLLLLAQLVAADAGIAARLFATRSDAEEFARVADEHGVAESRALAALPALATWRRAVLGTTWLAFLRGQLALTGDATHATGIAPIKL